MSDASGRNGADDAALVRDGWRSGTRPVNGLSLHVVDVLALADGCLAGTGAERFRLTWPRPGLPCATTGGS